MFPDLIFSHRWIQRMPYSGCFVWCRSWPWTRQVPGFSGWLAVVLLMGWLSPRGEAQTLLDKLNKNQVVYSQSRQFAVLVPEIKPEMIKDPEKAIEKNLLRLDGDLLVITADRVAASWYQFMGIPRQWKHPVFFKINTQMEPDSPVTVVINQFADQTQIVAEIPYFISREKLGRLFVQIVMREYLLCYPGMYSEDPPLWLGRAFERELLEGTFWRPLLEPKQRIHLNQQYVDSLVVSQVALGQQQLMSFEELSFPPPEVALEELREHYDVSAHIFLRKLCDLPDGKQKLVSMLQNLRNHLNWQVCLMKAFSSDFSNFLELEKWWALEGVQLIQRNEWHMLQPSESMARLEQILIRYQPIMDAPNAPPMESGESPSGNTQKPESFTLKKYIGTTPFFEHEATVRLVYRQLIFLYSQSHPVVAELLLEYINILETYINHRPSTSQTSRLVNSQSATPQALNRVIRDLDGIETRRLQTAARVAGWKLGVDIPDPLIQDSGSRVTQPRMR